MLEFTCLTAARSPVRLWASASCLAVRAVFTCCACDQTQAAQACTFCTYCTYWHFPSPLFCLKHSICLQCIQKCCEKFMNVSARTGARFQEFFTEMEKQVGGWLRCPGGGAAKIVFLRFT